jgi:uncharacterized membrane protein HdeD (DUF308 family)
MKTLLLILKFILAIALITVGVNNLSEPSNLSVTFGLLEIALALILIYSPVKSLIKNI